MNAVIQTNCCSCGDAEPHVIAKRTTADGKIVYLWDDGTITWALGAAVKGSWFKPSAANRARALCAGRLVMGEVSIYDAADVPALVGAARWAADRDGLPGTMRARLRRNRAALTPSWTVMQADARGAPTERVWVLPRLGPWAGHAVWDYCSHDHRGRYEIHSRTIGDSYERTGLRFTTVRALLAWMEANPPTRTTALATTDQPPASLRALRHVLERAGWELRSVDIDAHRGAARIEVKRADGMLVTLDVDSIGRTNLTREMQRLRTETVGAGGARWNGRGKAERIDRLRSEFVGRQRYATPLEGLGALCSYLADNAPHALSAEHVRAIVMPMLALPPSREDA